jgi:hypothetical protein
MIREIKTEILINVPTEKVWSAFINFEDYPRWNPFIKTIKGNLKTGNRIKVRLEPENGRGMTFKPKVLAFETNKRLRWLGHLLFPGLFDGEHTFELSDNGNGTTTFKQSEKFKGILVPLLKKIIDRDTKNNFNQMNVKLKELAERR